MEPNEKIKVYNSTLSLKGVEGTFITIGPEGYYEVYMNFEGKRHNVLLPVNNTVLVSFEPVVDSAEFKDEIVR